MYERSAIVLERFFEEKLGLNKRANLRTNYENFETIVEEMQRYQILTEEEEQIIKEFDKVAGEIQTIQKAQEKLYKSNQKLEDDRNQLFNNLDEDPISLEKKISKIENTIEKNNEDNKTLRADFIKYLAEFTEKQRERNKYAKSRRLAEANNMSTIEKATKELEEIDAGILKSIKESTIYEKDIEEQLSKIMISNGKEEKVGFNPGVINDAIKARLNIAIEESNCYALIYDRMKKILLDIDNDNLKIAKYQKTKRDIYVKLAFLQAKKDYIVRFLDNERMTAINGPKAHKKMMEEACENFETDIIQIDNLYELILRETTGKANKKSYKELYNKTYLKEIEEKEKNFEQEVNRIKIHAGTIINSNYWRIEGIKNIYEVFLKEVSQNFDRDLSEYTLEEPEPEDVDIEEVDLDEFPKKVTKSKNNKVTKPKIQEDNEDNEDDDFEKYEEDDDEVEDSDFEDEDDELEEDLFEDEDDEDDDEENDDEEEDDKIEFDNEEDDEFDFGEDEEEDDEDEDEYEDEDEDEDEEDYEDDDDDEIEFDDDFEEDEEDDDDDEIEFEDDFEDDIEEDVDNKSSKRKKKETKKENNGIFDKIFKDKKKTKK